MGRIRSIKPDYPQRPSTGRLSRDVRLLELQLLTVVDDMGRARATEKMLASLLYPYDDYVAGQIDKWLAELEAQSLIRRYEAEGEPWLEICNWFSHQKIDKPSKPQCPPPPPRTLDEPSTSPRRALATEVDVEVDVDVKQKQVPSRAKTARAANPDPRHSLFKKAVCAYWDSKNEAEMPWGGMEAKQLALLLGAMPTLTIDQFQTMLKGRAQSDVNHGDRPGRWIHKITSYGPAPVDRFNQPIVEGTNPNANKSQQRTDGNRAAACRILRDFNNESPVDPSGGEAGGGLGLDLKTLLKKPPRLAN